MKPRTLSVPSLPFFRACLAAKPFEMRFVRPPQHQHRHRHTITNANTVTVTPTPSPSHHRQRHHHHTNTHRLRPTPTNPVADTNTGAVPVHHGSQKSVPPHLRRHQLLGVPAQVPPYGRRGRNPQGMICTVHRDSPHRIIVTVRPPATSPPARPRACVRTATLTLTDPPLPCPRDKNPCHRGSTFVHDAEVLSCAVLQGR